MKISFLTSFLLLNVVLLTTSCSKEDKINGTPPTIQDVRFNEDMKIFYTNENGKGDSITINLKDKPTDQLDILLLDKPVTISGYLTSENGLTNMKIKIYGDTLNKYHTDTTTTSVNISVVPLTSFFGKTEDTMKNVTVTSSLASTAQINGDKKTVREGDEYQYNIYVIDREGKVDSTSYYQHPIRVLSVAEAIKEETNK